MDKGKVFFPNLDALRFMAFLGVFISHTLPLPEMHVSAAGIGDFILSALSFFYLGVPFFFTLSSFLITYKLLEEYKQNNRMKLFRFYLKRGLRIWPIYFLLLLVCFAGLPLLSKVLGIDDPTLPDALPFLLFYANFYMIDHGVQFIFALIPLWSIAIEEQFYIVWGLVLKFLKKFLVYFIFIILAISIAFSYYYLYEIRQTTTNLKLHSLYAVPDFCTGAIIAIICHAKNSLYTFLLSLGRYFYMSVYFVMIVFYVLQNFQITTVDPVMSNLFYAICYGLILFDQAFNTKRVFNAGGIKFINYLGRISYGLYIYHELAVSIMGNRFNFFSGTQPFTTTLLQSFISLCMTIIIAHISFRYFEKYFLRAKDRL